MPGLIKPVSPEQYARLVPSIRSDNPARVAWGVGTHIYMIGRDPTLPERVRAFLADHRCDAYIHLDPHLGAFVEFADAGAAMLFVMRFR